MNHRDLLLCASCALASCGALAACSPAQPEPAPQPSSESTDPATDGAEAGGAGQAAIRDAVRARAADFRACYDAGLASNPNLAGKVVVRFSLAPDGSVQGASASGDIADAEVTSCVVDVFESLKLDPPDGGRVTVSYPIVFAPTNDDHAGAPTASGPPSKGSGRIEPAAVQKVMRDNFGAFRACYEKGLAKDPELTGKITLHFVIDLDGRVAEGKPKGNFPDADVQKCVMVELTRLTFPKPAGGRVTISYPIVFSPSAK